LFDVAALESSVKIFGVITLIVGFVTLVSALNMETTVVVHPYHDGSWIGPEERVHNIGLMDERRNWLIVAGIILLAGILLLGFGSLAASRMPEAERMRQEIEKTQAAQRFEAEARKLAEEQSRRREQLAGNARAKLAKHGKAIELIILRTVLPACRAVATSPLRFDHGLKVVIGEEYVILYRFAQILIYLGVPLAVIVLMQATSHR